MTRAVKIQKKMKMSNVVKIQKKYARNGKKSFMNNL